MAFPAKPKKLSLRTRSLGQASSMVSASRFLRPPEAQVPDGARSYAPMIAADDHGHGRACVGVGACLIPAYRTVLRLGRVHCPPELAPAVPAVRWMRFARVAEVSAGGPRPTADQCVQFRMCPPACRVSLQTGWKDRTPFPAAQFHVFSCSWRRLQRRFARGPQALKIFVVAPPLPTLG